MLNSNLNMDLIKDYKNGKLNFIFPYIPACENVTLVYTEDDWASINEKKMTCDDGLNYFHTLLETKKNTGYRFKIKNKNNPAYFFEDNQMRNFYIPYNDISIQNMNNEINCAVEILCKGKNLFYSFIENSQIYSYIIFEWSNIFYYKSILDNFDTFYIAGKNFEKPCLTKKVIDKITWELPVKNDLFHKNLNSVIKNIVETKNIEIGVINLENCNRDILSNFYYFLNLNLDYFLYEFNLIWKTGSI